MKSDMKPVLFNTDMVRGLLNGTKTVTRRVVKPQYGTYVDGGVYQFDAVEQNRFRCAGYPHMWTVIPYPYYPGDILYVRETWTQDGDVYRYKAGFYDQNRKWRPSIHMPREAARLFLRVTDVRVERLQDITDEQVRKEGCCFTISQAHYKAFERLWDSTIKPADLDRYGWAANPWVWVIEFKRIGKEEAGFREH